MATDNTTWWVIGAGIVSILLAVYGVNYFKESQTCNPIWKQDRSYDKVTFCTKEEALAKADDIGCVGYHEHEQDGERIYMACAKHTDLDPYVKSTNTYSGGYGY